MPNAKSMSVVPLVVSPFLLTACDQIDSKEEIVENALIRAVMQDDTKWWLCLDDANLVEEVRPERATQIGKISGTIHHKSCNGEAELQLNVSVKYQLKDGQYIAEVDSRIVGAGYAKDSLHYVKANSVTWKKDADLEAKKIERAEELIESAKTMLVHGGRSEIDRASQMLKDLLGAAVAKEHFKEAYQIALNERLISAFPLRSMAGVKDRKGLNQFADTEDIDLSNAMTKAGALTPEKLTDEQMFFLALALRGKHGPNLDIRPALQKFVSSRSLIWRNYDQFQLPAAKQKLSNQLYQRYLGYLIAIWDIEVHIDRKERGKAMSRYNFSEESIRVANRWSETNWSSDLGNFYCGAERYVKELSQFQNMNVQWKVKWGSKARSGFARTRFFEAKTLCKSHDGSVGVRWPTIPIARQDAEQLFANNSKHQLSFSYRMKPIDYAKEFDGIWSRGLTDIPWQAEEIRVTSPINGHTALVNFSL